VMGMAKMPAAACQGFMETLCNKKIT